MGEGEGIVEIFIKVLYNLVSRYQCLTFADFPTPPGEGGKGGRGGGGAIVRESHVTVKRPRFLAETADTELCVCLRVSYERWPILTLGMGMGMGGRGRAFAKNPPVLFPTGLY